VNRKDVELAFRCGLDGTEWTARLGPVGRRLGFVGFRRPSAKADVPLPDEAGELRRQLDELLSARPLLSPPRSADVVSEEQQEKLTEDQTTDYGFECPSCGNVETLLCPECAKYSCRGLPRDAGGRIQCQWCGTTLVFGVATASEPGSGKKPPKEIEVRTERTSIRNRELPPGFRQLPPGTR
jgi:hypothetical protein